MDITAQEILNSLFNPEDKVCLRVFDDKKRGVFAGQKLDVECGKFASMYVEGFKAKLEKDTSYKGLWTVSFSLKEF